MKNEIYIRRRNCILLEASFKVGTEQVPLTYLASILKNIESLGYTFSRDVLETLSSYSTVGIHAFYEEIVPILKKIRGANVVHKPMYSNFPKQVMEESEAALYINALLHYFGDHVGVRILPDHEVEERRRLIQEVQLTVLSAGSEKEFKSFFTNLLASPTSTSPTDKEDIKWFVSHYKDEVFSFTPKTIPHKENLAFFTGIVLEHLPHLSQDLAPYYRTATDVLRLASAMSDGDVSLAANTKYKSFKRSERRFLLSLLENCSSLEGDLFSHRGKWIRLGERLHPQEYGERYKKVDKAFKNLRKGKSSRKSLNSLVEKLLEEGNTSRAAALLTTNPGLFARRLDHLVRESKTTKIATIIANKFAKVADKVSTPVLLQVANHFQVRNYQSIRTVFPKGSLAKVQSLENELPQICDKTCQYFSNVCMEALATRYKSLPKMGKVYVDPELKNFTVPFSQRSASKSLRTVSRGSKFDLAGGSTVRFFIHWRNIDNSNPRVDIDLSAMFFNSDWTFKENVSYTNLRSATYRAYHSGDITSAPRGASEFIDIDINSAIKAGARYLAMNVYSFTKQNFKDVPECFAGWMIREDVQSGEIFEPSTVQDKIDLTSEGVTAIPLIIDLVTRKVIWADISLRNNSSVFANNVLGNQKSVTLLARSIVELQKPDLYTLFSLHAKVRGKLVDTPEEADQVFSVREGITPFHIEEIVSQYLK